MLQLLSPTSLWCLIFAFSHLRIPFSLNLGPKLPLSTIQPISLLHRAFAEWLGTPLRPTTLSEGSPKLLSDIMRNSAGSSYRVASHISPTSLLFWAAEKAA